MNLVAKFVMVVLAAILLSATPAYAQGASGNAKVKAKVLKPLALTSSADLDLGTIVMPTSATFSGTFTVDPAATQTSTFCAGGFTCMGTVSAAIFNITGSKNVDISLSIPLTVLMTQTDYVGGGSAPTFTFNTTNSVSANNGTGVYTMQIPGSTGNRGLDFYIGGSATITETTPDGTYEGTINITADYL